MKHCGQATDLLVVPCSKVDVVMHLTHSYPLAGQLVSHNTLEDSFLWPGMNAEVKNFCQHCQECQRTAPKKPVPALLVPLPIISVPFERVGWAWI